MEFNEKLQELRKGKGLTQEELAEELFVSRTAVSKWESGRGYPSIDSLKAISRYFSVTIDELICPEEIISAAEEEKQAFAGASPAAVSLFGLTGIHSWVRIIFLTVIGLSALNGLCGLILIHFDRPVLNKYQRITGMVLSVLAVSVFIAARQPYAGILCFALLVTKTFVIMKMEAKQ